MAGYWDIPEGTDCPRKTFLVGRLGAGLGLLGSAYFSIVSPPKSVLHALQRATNATVTMATLGAVFGLTTCISAQIRDAPDEPLNYFVGGCSSGIVLGARANSFLIGTSGCISLGLVAMLTKMGKMEGWKVFPSKV